MIIAVKEFIISCEKLTRSQGKSKTESEKRDYQDDLILCKTCRYKYNCLNKYNVENIMQLPQIREKVKQNNLKKYGYEYTAQIPSIKEKIKQTNLKKYGVTMPMQNDLIKQKIQLTMLNKYGTIYALQVPEFKIKARNTMYKNNTIPTSKQQLYLYNILKENIIDQNNIILNYPFHHLSLDIILLNEKIDIEYNGGGHNLDVKLQGCLQEEFEQRELKRNKFIRSQGWEQIFIISPNDEIHNYTDKEYLKIMYIAKQYLLNTTYHWVNIYIEKDKFETNVYTQSITNILNL